MTSRARSSEMTADDIPTMQFTNSLIAREDAAKEDEFATALAAARRELAARGPVMPDTHQHDNNTLDHDDTPPDEATDTKPATAPR